MRNVVARHGGREVTDDDLAYRLHLAGEEADCATVVRAHLLTEAAAAEAAREGIGADPAVVEEKWNALLSSGGLPALRHATGWEDGRIRAALTADLTVEAFLADTGCVGDDEAVAYYESHLASRTLPARVRLRQILVTVHETLAGSDEASARERIEQIRSDPAPFEEKALRSSECPSAFNGGDLGLRRRDELYPEIADALFDLPAGAPPVTVRTELGWHLLEVTGREEARPLDRATGIATARRLMARTRRTDWMKRTAARIARETQPAGEDAPCR